MQESHCPQMPEAAQSLTASRDLTGYRVCRYCYSYFVEPDDVYTKGERKGEQQDNCRRCRKQFNSKNMPQHLVVSEKDKVLYKSQKGASNPVQQWLGSLNAEQESVLLHTSSTINQLPKGTQTSDISRATSDVHWDAIEERLRDIHSLERLFKGFESLMKNYKMEINTVHPVGLIAVSLNNCAVRSDQPFKFSWIQGCVVSKESGVTAAITISFEAWSFSEKKMWNTLTASQRLKRCSAWENRIQPSANSMLVPYKHMDSYFGDSVGNASHSSIHRMRNSLIWAKDIVDHLGHHKSGELLFPQGPPGSSRTRIDSSAKLLIVLAQAFHIQCEKEEWQLLRGRILEAMQDSRDPGTQQKAKFEELLRQRRHKLHDGLERDQLVSSIERTSKAILENTSSKAKRKGEHHQEEERFGCEKSEKDGEGEVSENDQECKAGCDTVQFRPAKKTRFTCLDDWLQKPITRR